MAQQQGSNTKLLYQSEPIFKQVPVNADAMVLPFTSESLKKSRNLISSKTIRSGRNPQMPVRGNVEVGGDISFEMSHQYGKMLHLALGSYVAVSGESVGMAAGTAKHTFKIGTLPSFTVEKQFPDLDTAKYFQYSGCRVNSLKVDIKSEGFIECSASLMGARETIANSSFDAAPVDLGHTPFDGFEVALTDGGAVLANCTEISFTVENNLDGSNYVIDGTGERLAIPTGVAKVTGSVTALFENSTLYEKAVNNTESVITIVLTLGTGVGTAGNEKLTITIPEVIYQPDAPAISGPEGIKITLPFEAYYDNNANATALMAELLSTTLFYG